MKRLIFLAALGCYLTGLTPPTWAQSNVDRCNDILKQDLFNKITSSSQSSSNVKAAFEEHIFSASVTEAYAEYDKAYKSSQAQKTTGGGEGHYAIAGGSFDFTHSYDRQLNETEFEERRQAAKEERKRDSISSSVKEESLISVYQSTVRDPQSVKAWEHCMETRYQEPGLFAYGYRDSSNNPYIVVMWMPGPFAVTAPVVNVKFGLTGAGMTIEGVDGPTQIATGSGTAFPISFKDLNDRKATSDGFTVLVNGELKDGDRLMQSFRAEAIVPRNLGPIPCSVVFTMNKTYEMGVVSDVDKQMHWGIGEFFTMNLEPTDQAGTLAYIVKFGPIAKPDRAVYLLRPSGSTMTITQRIRDKKDLTRWAGETAPLIRGECTGLGVQATMKTLSSMRGQGSDTIPISIRAR